MTSSARQMFLAQHANVHAAVSPGVLSLQDLICGPLSAAQLRAMPEGQNSIAWLLWHASRWEDVIVNACLHETAEVIDREGWLPSLNLERRDVGVGMTMDEVSEFSREVNVEALLAYRAAVARTSVETLTDADFDDLGRHLADASRRAGDARDFAMGAEFLQGSLSRQPVGWVLGYALMGHCYVHLGQARSVATILGNPGG